MRFFLAMFTSSFRNFSYCSLMYFSMGSQLGGGKRADGCPRKTGPGGSPQAAGPLQPPHFYLPWRAWHSLTAHPQAPMDGFPCRQD